MTLPDILSLLLLTLAPLVTALTGFALARRGRARWAVLLTVVLLTGGAIALTQSRRIGGWDGFGLYLIGIGYLWPAAAGSALGAGLGMWTGARGRQNGN